MKFVSINVSGVKFLLSEKSLYSDAPNMFTRRLECMEKVKKNGKRVMPRIAVDREPTLFLHISKYLQGYDLLVEQCTDIEIHHLKQDAQFYGLLGLKYELEKPKLPMMEEYNWLLSDSSSISSSMSDRSDNQLQLIPLETTFPTFQHHVVETTKLKQC